MNETELPADGPRPSAPTGPNTTPAVAAAAGRLAACQRATFELANALEKVGAVLADRSNLGVGVIGARNAPAGVGGPMGPVDSLVATCFQNASRTILADLFILLSAVRQAESAAARAVESAEAIAAFDRLDRPGDPARPSARHLRPDLADLDPADDPLSPADSEGGAL